jgi:type I restriction-modification system DNA methylase subunit
LVEPSLITSGAERPSGFVEGLDRSVTEKLKAFVLAVESREYFREYREKFDPAKRVDRDLLRKLEATRDLLSKVIAPQLEKETLDFLLCRLVFTCYLFDRGIIDHKYLELIGILNAEHLRDILARDKRSEAKSDLYTLFKQLGQDFNGDLFNDDLDAEMRQVRVEHLDLLNHFFKGTDPRNGQQTFWPHEFGIIPIETISAIYEHFLKVSGEKERKVAGAFYTPRFLAEVVLDQALSKASNLLNKRFFDPACGSGIFLVGLFNRLAEEWTRLNPDAEYNAKLKGLTQILETNLYGNDKNPTACRIAAFSLYLALLDQLSPPDIRCVLKEVKVLPRLVAEQPGATGRIRCADFFSTGSDLPEKVDFVVGNPPWAKSGGTSSPPALWCRTRHLPFPGDRIETAFVWKAQEHLTPDGAACFVLPHGILFNHNQKSLDFQKELNTRHAVLCVINLADYQFFLFEEARQPAIILHYSKKPPVDSGHNIEYWSPKTDWAVTQADIISILVQDRACLSVREVLNDLRSDDAPLIWKDRYWATFRDRRLLERLRLYPRLRVLLGQRGHTPITKRWVIAEGFEPHGKNDTPETLTNLKLPQTAKVEAGTHTLDVFLNQDDCTVEAMLELNLRRGISNLDIFKKPLVLVTEGFKNVAFANYNIAYRHGIRGIHGPSKDTSLLVFLTFYLRSRLARYFLFHTSASWGVSRTRIDINDLMRLPFPLPAETANPTRSSQIVDTVSNIMAESMKEARRTPLHRDHIVQQAQVKAERLVEEYFDINDIERILINDTNTVIIPSVRPLRSKPGVPTIQPATETHRDLYSALLCTTLNQWAHKDYSVHGKSVADAKIGLGMMVLEKTRRGQPPTHLDSATTDVLATLSRIQKIAGVKHGTLELVRGLKVFDKTLLFVTKPIGLRFWTGTAALNDADDIAGTLLMRPSKEGA